MTFIDSLSGIYVCESLSFSLSLSSLSREVVVAFFFRWNIQFISTDSVGETVQLVWSTG